MVLRFIRQNAIALLALFVALGGTGAYAANTIFSSDIVDGEVKNPDLATGAVSSSKILDGGVLWADLGDSQITSSKVRNASILGLDLQNDTVTGTQVKESTLGQVPDAANLGGHPAEEYQQFSRVNNVATSDCVTTTNIWFGCAPISVTVPSGHAYVVTVSSTINAFTSTTQTIGFCAAYDGPQCLDLSGTPELLTIWGGAYTMGTSSYTWYIGGPATYTFQTAVKVLSALSATPNGKVTTRVDAYDAAREIAH